MQSRFFFKHAAFDLGESSTATLILHCRYAPADPLPHDPHASSTLQRVAWFMHSPHYTRRFLIQHSVAKPGQKLFLLPTDPLSLHLRNTNTEVGTFTRRIISKEQLLAARQRLDQWNGPACRNHYTNLTSNKFVREGIYESSEPVDPARAYSRVSLPQMMTLEDRCLEGRPFWPPIIVVPELQLVYVQTRKVASSTIAKAMLEVHGTSCNSH